MPLVPDARPALRRAARLATGCALLLAAALATAQGVGDTSTCSVLWQVTAQPGSAADGPPGLRVRLRFAAGSRSQTALHLPGGWADHTLLPAAPDAPLPRLRADGPAWRTVSHAPGETVHLQWRLQPAGDATQGGHVQITPDWLAFSGQGVLPMPEGADAAGSGPACVALDGMPAPARWASSHGTAEGTGALFVLGPSPVPLAQRVQQALYAGGALQWQAAPGVLAVLPAAAPWPFNGEAVAQAGARALSAQQRQWPAPVQPAANTPWLLLVLPTAAHTGAAAPDTTLASAWQQALALQLPPAWAGSNSALEAAFTQALARAWTAERFGPLAHAGRGDAALRAWFSDGWADFLAHRSLLREGLWTADDYAGALNTRIAAYLAEPARALPNAQVAAASTQAPQLAALQALRGEWLALQWHQALRRAGHPGLDAVLRQQLVPADQARRDGPISAPLATHRVVAALRAVLQDQPLRDLQQHIDQGQPFGFDSDSLGPCFVLATPASPAAAPAYRPVAAALQQPACQGWLGTGDMAAATALPRRASPQAVRARGAKAGAKATTKSTAKSTTKAGTRAGAKAAKPGAKSAAKPTRPAGAKPQARRSTPTKPAKPAR